jgi:hypothetical protein
MSISPLSFIHSYYQGHEVAHGLTKQLEEQVSEVLNKILTDSDFHTRMQDLGLSLNDLTNTTIEKHLTVTKDGEAFILNLYIKNRYYSIKETDSNGFLYKAARFIHCATSQEESPPEAPRSKRSKPPHKPQPDLSKKRETDRHVELLEAIQTGNDNQARRVDNLTRVVLQTHLKEKDWNNGMAERLDALSTEITALKQQAATVTAKTEASFQAQDKKMSDLLQEVLRVTHENNNKFKEEIISDFRNELAKLKGEFTDNLTQQITNLTGNIQSSETTLNENLNKRIAFFNQESERVMAALVHAADQRTENLTQLLEYIHKSQEVITQGLDIQTRELQRAHSSILEKLNEFIEENAKQHQETLQTAETHRQNLETTLSENLDNSIALFNQRSERIMLGLMDAADQRTNNLTQLLHNYINRQNRHLQEAHSSILEKLNEFIEENAKQHEEMLQIAETHRLQINQGISEQNKNFHLLLTHILKQIESHTKKLDAIQEAITRKTPLSSERVVVVHPERPLDFNYQIRSALFQNYVNGSDRRENTRYNSVVTTHPQTRPFNPKIALAYLLRGFLQRAPK